MEKINSKKGFVVFSIILFIVFALLEVVFPLSGDDWYWGGTSGKELLDSWFAGYNGRYAGNLLEIVLTRVDVLRVIIKAIFFYLVVYLTYKISKTRNIMLFAFSAMLFFIIPKLVFVQSIVWTAGFSNYVSPIVLALLFFVILENSKDVNNKKSIALYSIASLVIGYIGCLFMENMTIYYLFLAFCTFVYFTAKNKKFATIPFFFGIGSLAGAICMFTNSVYLSIFSGDDSYRSVSSGTSELRTSIIDHLYCTIDYLFLDNIVFITIFSAVIFGLLLFSYKNLKSSQKKLSIVCITVNLISLVLLYLKNSFIGWNTVKYLFQSETKEEHYRVYLLTLCAFVYFASAVIVVLLCVRNKERKIRIAFEAASVIVILLPLFVVSPYGPRCVYPVYAFMALIAVEILAELISENDKLENLSKLLLIPIIAVCVGVNIYHFSIYIPIHQVDKARIEYVSEQVEEGKTEIELYKLPYDSYVWHGNPENNKWLGESSYKDYYGIDENSQLELIDYQS